MTRTREHALRKAALPYGAGVIRATGEIVLFNRTYELLWRLPPEDGQQAAKTRNPYDPHWITDADGYEIEPLELAGRFPVRGTRDLYEVNRDPNENMLRACYEAEQQHAKLRRQYDRSRKKAATGAPENGAAAPAD